MHCFPNAHLVFIARSKGYLMKNKFFFVSFLAASLLIPCALSSQKTELSEVEETVHKQEKQEVLSYKGVLASYYNLAVKGVENPTKTVEEFVDGFYADGITRDLRDYTLKFAEENANSEQAAPFLKTDKKASVLSGGGGGTNGQAEDYILKSLTEEGVTPTSHFARPPLYGTFDYSNIQVGDILYEAAGSIGSVTGHAAFVTSIDHESAYGNYIQTVEAVSPCVSYGFIDDNRMVLFKASIYRVVEATYYVIISAKNFVLMQLGDSWNFHSGLHTSIYSDNWYCSELVWAAYNFTYIDLRNNKNSSYCMPADLKNSNGVTQVMAESAYQPKFLNLAVVSKSGNTWRIRATNRMSKAVTVRYNPTMCFYDDAKNWKNLSSNPGMAQCKAYGSVEFTIRENWFATHIAVCFIDEYVGINYRNISFADQLNSSNKTLSQGTNSIRL